MVSRNSTGQERNDKSPGSSPLHTAPLPRGGSTQELLDSPALEETCQEAYDIAAAVEESVDPEQTLSDELGETHHTETTPRIGGVHLTAWPCPIGMNHTPLQSL